MPFTNYWKNRAHDFLSRGQAFVPAANRWLGIFVAMPTAAGGGTEAAYSGYARQAYNPTLANWSGTQGAGTTAVSSGTSGLISNNVALVWSAALPSALSGVCAVGEFDALTAGNLLRWAPLVDAAGNPITKSFSAGEALRAEIGEIVLELAA